MACRPVWASASRAVTYNATPRSSLAAINRLHHSSAACRQIFTYYSPTVLHSSAPWTLLLDKGQ